MEITPDNPTELVLQQVSTWADAAVRSVPSLTVAILVIAVVWLVSRLSRLIIFQVGRRAGLRRNLLDVFQLIASTVIWLIGILLALTIVFPTVTPGKALTTLGLGSVAIGFAFKDTFENFLAGILLLLREPFKLDDYIECEGVDGKVEEITIRDTHIRQTDGQLVVMPNSHLFKNAVTVRTNQSLRRVALICGVAYHEDVAKSRNVIENAVRAVDMVRDDVRDIQVFACEFNSSSIDFEVTWWTGSEPRDIRASRDKVVEAVKSALDEAEIEIPFPYRTLTVNGPLPIRLMEAEAE